MLTKYKTTKISEIWEIGMVIIQTIKTTTQAIKIIIQATKINTLTIKAKINQQIKNKKRTNIKI